MAVDFKDYYKILGVDKKANEKEIRAAYRKLARKYHPDVNPGDNAAEEKFKEINEANEVLSDPEKRKKYDELSSIITSNMDKCLALVLDQWVGMVEFDTSIAL